MSAACPRIQVVLQWHPLLSRPSFEKRTKLVRWIQHTLLKRLLQCHLGARLVLCTFATSVLTPHFKMTAVHQYSNVDFLFLSKAQGGHCLCVIRLLRCSCSCLIIPSLRLLVFVLLVIQSFVIVCVPVFQSHWEWRQKLPDCLMPRLSRQGLILKWTAWTLNHQKWRVTARCAGRIKIDDCENTTFEGKISGSGSEETGQAARQEQHHNAELLQQMTPLCQTVQNLGKQMQEGFAAEKTRRQQDFDTESQKRQDDYNDMERTMTAKMASGTNNRPVNRLKVR